MVIKKNDNDTDNPVKYQYIKQHIAPLKADFADEIVLSAYSTWGINHDIIIKQNGAVLYRGFNSNNKLEYLTANISLDKFISIEQGFAKADFLRLKHDYSTNGADGSEVSISFVKDGKIIKSIHDYERSGPFELVWAYLPLEYLHEHLKFKPVDGKFLSPDVQLPFFEKGSDRGFINSSAGFYLLSLIRSGKLTNKKFHPEYRLKFYKSDNLLKMETDGQIYQANWEDGGQTSYDIGFNFINNNQDKIGFIKNLATGQIKFPPPLRKYSHPKKPNHQ
ncbi:MAG: hypothetical protein ABIN91_07425 [Mucilaginibacter sp.]|uniref:DUF6438 domain-containing protein n=1 Tax=Mucilaginibacter sp. TaxID=1882438 RepID=UPI0032666FD0